MDFTVKRRTKGVIRKYPYDREELMIKICIVHSFKLLTKLFFV